MRQIDHFIVGGSGGAPARKGQVFDPNTGAVQAEVALGDAATLERAVQAAVAALRAHAERARLRTERAVADYLELALAEAHEQKMSSKTARQCRTLTISELSKSRTR